MCVTPHTLDNQTKVDHRTNKTLQLTGSCIERVVDEVGYERSKSPVARNNNINN